MSERETEWKKEIMDKLYKLVEFAVYNDLHDVSRLIQEEIKLAVNETTDLPIRKVLENRGISQRGGHHAKIQSPYQP
jgi:hypothetical protein